MCATFNGNSRTIIVSSFSPTNATNETDITTFYNELSFFVQHIPKHNVLFIERDLNADIGKCDKNKFYSHNSSYRNGEYLAEFSDLYA